MAEVIRYRARVVRPATALDTLVDSKMTVEWTGAVHAKRSAAIKEGVDHALSVGVVEIIEVPMKRRTKTEYVEVKGDGKT